MSEHPTIEEVYKRPEYFDAVWSKSIEYYGVTKQSVVCMEECAELIEAYDDRKRDGLTDGTRSHMVEEMADVLICLWLLEHMYDIKGCDNRTRHPSPVGQRTPHRHVHMLKGNAVGEHGRRAIVHLHVRRKLQIGDV